jgi:ribosome-associated protein
VTATDLDPREELLGWVRAAAQAADDGKGSQVVVLDVGDVLAITEFFVIVSAPNSRLVRFLAESIEEKVADAGGPKPLRVEGMRELLWVLLDYGDWVVHVFDSDTRRFYDLERLWRDVPRVEWSPGS